MMRIVKEVKEFFWLPIGQQGWSLRAWAGAISVILLILYLPLGLIAFACFLYIHIILRKVNKPASNLPASNPMTRKENILAPIDGVIRKIDYDENQAQIKIYIAPDWFDSHLIYPPIKGYIEQLIWYDGQFASHQDDKIPSHNARQEFLLLAENGTAITIEQYASPLTRLLLSFTQEERNLLPNEPFAVSLIRPVISIQFDIAYIPKLYQGQRCLAGETILNTK